MANINEINKPCGANQQATGIAFDKGSNVAGHCPLSTPVPPRYTVRVTENNIKLVKTPTWGTNNQLLNSMDIPSKEAFRAGLRSPGDPRLPGFQ